ncbi:hypothetical protein [Actinomadura nitritigenes]|uniref:hypothetical protein n=1 Tax=Actinomadura nitritigenes TaxID=134602 RepID=UPI003D8F2364
MTIPLEPEKPFTGRADHVDGEYDDLIELCEGTVSTAGLHLVAHYHLGIWDFVVDVLGQDELVDALPGTRTADAFRRELLRIGRRLNGTVHRLDYALSAVDSGRLIRTVFDLGSRAVYHYPVRRDQYLLGATLRGDLVGTADAAMANLVERVRDMRRLAPQNPGGFTTTFKVTYDAATAQEPVVAHVSQPGDEEVQEQCANVLDPENVHYVSLFRDGVLRLAVDCLDHPALRNFHQRVTPEDRRTGYLHVANLVQMVTAQFNLRESSLLDGRVTRTVLDVEEGALSCFTIREEPARIMLVGITLDQRKVDVADHELCHLAATLRELADRI